MELKGRSPFKDVTRSVIMGAAMVPAAALAGCARHGTPPNPPTGGSGGDGTVQLVATDKPDAAPPVEVVRPRTPDNTGNTNSMPTRGFAGAVRARG